MIAIHTEELPLVGVMTFAATASGLCLISRGAPEAARAFLERRYPGARLQPDPDATAAAVRQLREYLLGARREFELPLDPAGTPFQRRVWDALARIPYGETRSYGEIAREIGQPGAARAVGAANRVNPLCIVIPCHRVIGTSGRLVGYAAGLEMKESLLRLEGGNLRVPDKRTSG